MCLRRLTAALHRRKHMQDHLSGSRQFGDGRAGKLDEAVSRSRFRIVRRMRVDLQHVVLPERTVSPPLSRATGSPMFPNRCVSTGLRNPLIPPRRPGNDRSYLAVRNWLSEKLLVIDVDKQPCQCLRRHLRSPIPVQRESRWCNRIPVERRAIDEAVRRLLDVHLGATLRRQLAEATVVPLSAPCGQVRGVPTLAPQQSPSRTPD